MCKYGRGCGGFRTVCVGRQCVFVCVFFVVLLGEGGVVRGASGMCVGVTTYPPDRTHTNEQSNTNERNSKYFRSYCRDVKQK